MKLGKLLFKPKWQDKDAAIRRVAVANDIDADLIAALPELLRGDPDAGVRLAALKRVNDYELWRERSTGDSEHTVRTAARAAYLQQFCADLPGGPPLPRRIAELETLSDDELERVATSAAWRELRTDALKRLRKPTLFLDRALNDSDAVLRLEALHRIDDVALLDRAAERARKTDKVISRRAKELADALRVERGDAAVINERARRLCERMETLMRTSSRDLESVAAIDTEWQRLGATIPAELARRYDGARAVVFAPPPQREGKIVADVPIAAPELPIEPLVSQTYPDTAVTAATEETKRQRQQFEAKTRELSECVARFQSAVDSGDTAAAAKAHAEIDSLVAGIGTLPASLRSTLAPVRERESELQRWLHWSNNRRRKAICGEIETLSGAHPDALATRVRELRDEWQRLSTSTPAPAALEQRFQHVSNRLLRTARPYFEKREEVRRTHGDEMNALLGRADALAESEDWKAMLALRTELSAALRALDRVDPRERSAFAKRIKKHMDALGQRIAAHDTDIEQAKSRLIERAEKLAETSDSRETAKQARELQTQWTALGSGRRSTDQKQWRLFRTACDAAFGKLSEQRKEREEKSATQRAQAVTIVERLESVAATDAEPDALRAALREAETQWQANADRALESRFREARDAIARVVKDAARRKRLRRFTQAIDKDALLRDAEPTALALDEQSWTQIGASAPEFEAHFRRRLERIGAEENSAASAEHVIDLLVRLESLAGIESPAKDRQRRMNLQVQRLSARVRHGQSASPEDELSTILSDWFALAGEIDAESRKRFERAAKTAVDNLP
ncbi:MAG TPA: DUF349 domain-containing protein [Rudaea sp.]|jgi:hypothetical protein|nr:DUF349 domain-containing protein [Rudaea sp.]